MAATTTLYAYIHGLANASRACSAFNSGYQPAAQMMWKTANTDAQSAAAYATQRQPRSSLGPDETIEIPGAALTRTSGV